MNIVALLLVIAGLDYLYLMRRRNVIIQHKFRLYALRDSLRATAADGRVKASNWVFQYLDSSIAKTIDALPAISVWRVGSLLLFSPADPKMKARLDQLSRELKKVENEPLAEIYVNYLMEVGFFISHRHGSCWVLIQSLFRVFRSGQWLKDKYRYGKEILTAAPETSTLQEFIRC